MYCQLLGIAAPAWVAARLKDVGPAVAVFLKNLVNVCARVVDGLRYMDYMLWLVMEQDTRNCPVADYTVLEAEVGNEKDVELELDQAVDHVPHTIVYQQGMPWAEICHLE